MKYIVSNGVGPAVTAEIRIILLQACFVDIPMWSLKHSMEIKLLHPNISMYFLHNVLYRFHMVLTTRICLKIKSFFCWRPFSLFS